jgi:hypothetical protein
MTHPVRFFAVSGVIVALAIAGIYAIKAEPDADDKAAPDTLEAGKTPAARTDPAKDTPASMDNRIQLSEAEAAAVKSFDTQVKEYAALHKKLEGNMPALDQNSTPEEIDAHRTQLRAALKTARIGAKRGDLFTPAMETLVRRMCNLTVQGADGKQNKETIMDENVKMPVVTVNEHYPDGVPVTTMPAELLETLPKLPEYMEYHFVGKKLVLVDSAAGLVVDFTPDVLS